MLWISYCSKKNEELNHNDENLLLKPLSICPSIMHTCLIYIYIPISSICIAIILSIIGPKLGLLNTYNIFSNLVQTEVISFENGHTLVSSDHQNIMLSRFKENMNGDQYKSSLAAINKERNKRDINGEALASLHLAKEMWESGKVEKATKIYQHALALNPHHPDILNEYGEFLEKTHDDIIKAEHMYCRALVSSPEHTKALTNRQRTLPLVEDIDQKYFNRIESKRDVIINIPDNHPGLRRMKKESYFKHIHHTTAIEGNTFTLAQTRSLIETRIVVSGKSIMEHNEILGMDAALHYVNSTLVHRIGAIKIEDILDIQKRVLGYVDPIGAGMFRITQVFVGDHIPPAASEIDKLMEEFLQWLNSEEALSLHPIEFAALAHYKLVYIHPFYDGNGRTSRLLMNLILMQAGYPPIIIRKEEKLSYYEYLETGNAGDIRPFIRFIARCTERTLDEYIWATSENAQAMSSIFVMDDGRTIILEPDDNDKNKIPVDLSTTENQPVDNDINNNDENNNGETLEHIIGKP